MQRKNDFFAYRSRRRQRLRQRDLFSSLVIGILIVLCLIPDCSENQPLDGSQPELISSKSKQSSMKAFKRSGHMRPRIGQNLQQGLPWSMLLKERIALFRLDIHRCLDDKALEYVVWKFQYNPYMGQVIGTIFLDDAEQPIIVPCLDEILSGPFKLAGRDGFQDNYYKMRMHLAQVAL